MRRLFEQLHYILVSLVKTSGQVFHNFGRKLALRVRRKSADNPLHGGIIMLLLDRIGGIVSNVPGFVL